MFGLVPELIHQPIAIKSLILRFLHDRLLRLTHRANLEKTVHFVERYRLGLRNEEPHEREAANRDSAEQVEDTKLVHAVYHVRRDARDDKSPEPVSHRSEQLAYVAGTLAEEFGVDHPGCAVPGVDIDGCPEVNDEHCSDARWAERCCFRLIGLFSNRYKGADDEHGY